MMKIGLTGGIGSGKSTVAGIFEVLGIPVYYADDRAKWLMAHNPKLKTQIIRLLSDKAYHADGTLNRGFIAAQVFSNKELLTELNKLVHPAVLLDGDQWHDAQQAPYTIKEAALLYESRSAQYLDAVIEVFAPKKVRIQRVRKRDRVTRQQVINRMNNQLDERLKLKWADYVIRNDGRHPLIQQVWHIHNTILGRVKAGDN